jgi:hypothetical protein
MPVEAFSFPASVVRPAYYGDEGEHAYEHGYDGYYWECDHRIASLDPISMSWTLDASAGLRFLAA